MNGRTRLNNPWTYVQASAGLPPDDSSAIDSLRERLLAWRTRALAAEAANRELRRQNDRLRARPVLDRVE